METARKRWKLSEKTTELKAWRRPDGKIDLWKFKPEFLETADECAAVTAELDQTIEHFASLLRGFNAELQATGVYTDKQLFYRTRRPRTLAKIARTQVQDRRGMLRRAENIAKREVADIRSERAFVEAAKQMLPREQYLAIWNVVNGHASLAIPHPASGPSSPSREAAAGPCNGNDGSSASGSPVIPGCTDAALPAAAASSRSTEGPHGAGQEFNTMKER
jgi:hypothetical protein